MNLLILKEIELLDKNIYKIQNRKKNHLIDIKKVYEGFSLPSARLNLDIGEFKVLEINEEYIIGEYFLNKIIPKKDPYIELFISYQRPQTMKKIFQLVGTLQIQKVNIFPLSKSEKSYEKSSIWKEESWKEELDLGMEQGKNIYYPEILFFENKIELKDLIHPNKSILLDPSGSSMKKAFSNFRELNSVQLILGPEGGLNERDINYFITLGAIKTKISESILRTEQALAFVIGQIELIKEYV
jgi:RsmE family RNA methyltransferase